MYFRTFIGVKYSISTDCRWNILQVHDARDTVEFRVLGYVVVMKFIF